MYLIRSVIVCLKAKHPNQSKDNISLRVLLEYCMSEDNLEPTHLSILQLLFHLSVSISCILMSLGAGC